MIAFPRENPQFGRGLQKPSHPSPPSLLILAVHTQEGMGDHQDGLRCPEQRLPSRP